jgi:hypothetical protein
MCQKNCESTTTTKLLPDALNLFSDPKTMSTKKRRRQRDELTPPLGADAPSPVKSHKMGKRQVVKLINDLRARKPYCLH